MTWSRLWNGQQCPSPGGHPKICTASAAPHCCHPGRGLTGARAVPVNVSGGQQVQSVSLVSSASSELCRYYLINAFVEFTVLLPLSIWPGHRGREADAC